MREPGHRGDPRASNAQSNSLPLSSISPGGVVSNGKKWWRSRMNTAQIMTLHTNSVQRSLHKISPEVKVRCWRSQVTPASSPRLTLHRYQTARHRARPVGYNPMGPHEGCRLGGLRGRGEAALGHHGSRWTGGFAGSPAFRLLRATMSNSFLRSRIITSKTSQYVWTQILSSCSAFAKSCNSSYVFGNDDLAWGWQTFSHVVWQHCRTVHILPCQTTPFQGLPVWPTPICMHNFTSCSGQQASQETRLFLSLSPWPGSSKPSHQT
ncbi:hypothetical protein C8R44DRAFT_308485 [Mycena epipterygia]|nr:hypothetical protein C8R44DRAFT_308485 [Mycena epipterygia]